MEQLPKPYIGISGVGNKQQQLDIARMFEQNGLGEVGRFALLGVKATTKSQLLSKESIGGALWYPPAQEMPYVIDTEVAGHGVLQMYQSDRWKDLLQSMELLEKSYERTRGWLHGIQFDLLPWMEQSEHCVKILGYARDLLMDLGRGALFLQCQDSIMQPNQNNRSKVMDQLSSLYERGMVDYVLFDASCSTGKEMNPEALKPWLHDARKAMPALGLAVAGGLDAETIQEHLPSLLNEVDELSWDAEGRLHNPKPSKGGDGDLNMQNVADYLEASAKVLGVNSAQQRT